MILAAFPLSVWIAGALVLAAILVVLQRLRVQRQVVRVATSLFWREAARAAPASVLHRRFRHLLAFLLVLLIVGLLWFASALPMLRPVAGAQTDAFYLDASAAMTAGDRFGEARRALIADVGAVPADHRAVYFGDLYGTRLLAPGEDIALLARRLAQVRPQAFASAFPAWFRTMRAQWQGNGPVKLHYYGSAATMQAALSSADAETRLVQGYIAPPIAGNRGIVALGAVPAASGAWDKADIVLRLAASEGAAPAPSTLVFRRDGKPFTPALTALPGGRALLRDVPADGTLLEAAFRTGDGFPADDRAALRLPERHPIRVAILGPLPSSLRAVLAADDAIRLTRPADAEVLVTEGSGQAAVAKPSLLLAPAASQPATFAFTLPQGGTTEMLTAALDQLGLGKLDARDLADALHRPVTVAMQDGGVRTIAVWRELFDPEGDFARTRTMPLFVGRAIRWLAAPKPWIPFAPAGGVLTDRVALDPWSAGSGIALPAMGATRLDGAPAEVSLTDAATTRGTGATLPADQPGTASHPLPRDLPFTLALVAAALLLAGEWVLFQRGRLP
ncbi:hypothetical protein ACG3SL_08305 [Sphingomonas sp. CJ20]